MTTYRPLSPEPAWIPKQHEIYAWLGFWRDQFPPEAVTNLQKILGELSAYAVNPDTAERVELSETGNRIRELEEQNSNQALAFQQIRDALGLPSDPVRSTTDLIKNAALIRRKLDSATKWIPIAERKPTKEDTYNGVLLYRGKLGMYFGEWDEPSPTNRSGLNSATHWCPIPPFVEKKKAEAPPTTPTTREQESASAATPSPRAHGKLPGQAYRWTPLHIELMLHYYTTSVPHPNIHAPAVLDFTDDLLKLDLIERTKETKSGFKVTKHGKVWADAICSTPIPHLVGEGVQSALDGQDTRKFAIACVCGNTIITVRHDCVKCPECERQYNAKPPPYVFSPFVSVLAINENQKNGWDRRFPLNAGAINERALIHFWEPAANQGVQSSGDPQSAANVCEPKSQTSFCASTLISALRKVAGRKFTTTANQAFVELADELEKGN